MPDTMPVRTWTPNTWRDSPIRQEPIYPDPRSLTRWSAASADIRRWYSPARHGV